jgi:hypothetical protein
MAIPRDRDPDPVPDLLRRVPVHFTVGYGWFTATLDGRVMTTSGPHMFLLPPGDYEVEGTLSSDGRLGALVQVSFTSYMPRGSGDNGVLLGSVRSVAGPEGEALRGYAVLYDFEGRGQRRFRVAFTVTGDRSPVRTCPP